VAEMSSGSIELTTAKCKVEGKNSGGNLRLDEAVGETVARTSSGSVAIKVAKGKVDARNS